MSGTTDIEDKDGVSWLAAPLPRRWHRCWPQTRVWFGLIPFDRCACGAALTGRGPWISRNSRRRHGWTL